MAFLIDRLPQLGAKAAYTLQAIRNKLTEHREYIRTYGQDMPEVRDWKVVAGVIPSDRCAD